jgi:hypothetical protein
VRVRTGPPLCRAPFVQVTADRQARSEAFFYPAGQPDYEQADLYRLMRQPTRGRQGQLPGGSGGARGRPIGILGRFVRRAAGGVGRGDGKLTPEVAVRGGGGSHL